MSLSQDKIYFAHFFYKSSNEITDEWYFQELLEIIVRKSIRYDDSIIMKIFDKINEFKIYDSLKKYLMPIVMEELKLKFMVEQNIENFESIKKIVMECNNECRLIALCCALKFRSPKISLDMIEWGIMEGIRSIDVNPTLNPLKIALNQNNNVVVNKLINLPCFINCLSQLGPMPLGRALLRGDLKYALELVRSGCEVNIQISQGMYPIHYAVSFDRKNRYAVQLFDALISRKEININQTFICWYQKIKKTYTPLALAIEKGNYFFAKKLIRLGCDMTSSSFSLLCTAHRSNKQIIGLLLRCDQPDPAQKLNYYKWEMIEINLLSCFYIYRPIIKKLIQLISLLDIDGSNLLHYAIRTDLDDCAIKLIDSGININLVGLCGGHPPLYDAVYNGNDKIFYKLISHPNIDVNIKTLNCDDPLLLAAYLGRTDYFESLLKAGADPFSQNNSGENVMHLAASEGHIDIVKSFKKYLLDQSYQTIID